MLADTAAPSATWLEAYIPPADRPAVEAAIQAAIAGPHFFALEHRVLRADGGLSAREQEILRLVADGMTTAQIVEKLHTSPRTVETHRRNIMEKAGAKNTAALVKVAMSQGWLS
ncbi:MAG: helix-turn-helix domain-containing protein [Hymenobacter sp.]|nr:helix-turn-helix domain-containing protein [Hymenobacter sp.]